MLQWHSAHGKPVDVVVWKKRYAMLLKVGTHQPTCAARKLLCAVLCMCGGLQCLAEQSVCV